ncbi:HDOD domain-containing protein [Deferribacter thermophilus]|uniref:HDOD domain-containing protein n=1 Tax=Deferribacter thermophilus TaxID=53573 RepID=UPI003C2A20AA
MKFDSDVIIKKANNIPPLPQIAARVLSILKKENYTLSEIVYLVSKDLGLTTEILKMANSAIFSPKEEIKDLRHAIVILGEKNLKNLLIALSMKSYFYNDETKIELARGIWEHSLCVAILMRILGSYKNIDTGDAFLLGILHDIGKVIFLLTTPFYDEIVNITKKGGVNSIEIESNLIGFNHAEIGGYVLSKWGLPELFYEKVYYHHDMTMYQKDDMLALLVVSNCLINKRKIGLNIYDEESFKIANKKLDLSEDIIDSAMMDFDEIYKEEKSLFEGRI